MCTYAVEAGGEMGASYVEARVVSRKRESYSLRNGTLLSAGYRETRGMGIRVIANGSLAFFSTIRLDRPSVRDAVRQVVRLARSVKRRRPVELSEEDVHQDRWRTPVKKPFLEVDEDEKLSFLRELDSRIRQISPKVVLRRFSVEMTVEDKALVTSEGAKIEGSSSLFSLATTVQVSGNERSEQRRMGIGGSGGWEWASDETIDRVVRDAEATVDVVQRARTFKPGKMDVVIGSEVAGIIAHENCGHPSEGDRILGREAAQAGESWFSELTVGESRVGSEAVTVIDDPTLPGNPAFYLYDDEGVKARPRQLIKNGVLNELLLNREAAAMLGTGSTAAARAEDYDREPIVRMANTFIAPGDYDPEEILEDVENGILISSFTEWNIDDRRYHSKYVGSYARRIVKGELGELVWRPVLELSTPGLFGSIDACSKGFAADLATCGKSEPMQGVPVWTGGPAAVRLRDVVVGA